METKEALLRQVVDLEWEMFTAVESLDSRPSCQDDRAGFEIMRRSQYGPWPGELLAEYLAFLIDARNSQRNVVAEKYARMMKSTHPGEYAALAGKLPPLGAGETRLIRECLALHLEWKRGCDEKYPCLKGRGRELESRSDSRGNTSFETYLEGELSTYSLGLLRDYRRFLGRLEAENRNLAEMILEETARLLGYASLDEMEEHACSRRETKPRFNCSS